MLKIQCPQCKKSFLWSDDMPTSGKCPTADCNWQYDIHAALKSNIESRAGAEGKKSLYCPACGAEVSSRFTICPHCRCIVLGSKSLKKRYIFLAVCIALILLSLIVKYVVR